MNDGICCVKCGMKKAGKGDKDTTILVVPYEDAETGQPLIDYRCRGCGARWTIEAQPVEPLEKPTKKAAREAFRKATKKAIKKVAGGGKKKRKKAKPGSVGGG